MVKKNVKYPDFETEINIKLDNMFKEAYYRGHKTQASQFKYLKDDLEKMVKRILKKSPDYKTKERLLGLIDEYVGEDAYEDLTALMAKKSFEYVELLKDYYDSEDFENEYIMVLLEDLNDHGPEELKKMLDYAEIDLPPHVTLKDIISYISENSEEYINRFRGWYTGEGELASVSFGEQEEEMPEYGMAEIFKDEGFYVDEKTGYMYYDMSDEGLYISLNDEQFEDLITWIGQQKHAKGIPY